MTNVIIVVNKMSSPSVKSFFIKTGTWGSQCFILCGLLINMKIKSDTITNEMEIINGIALIFVVNDKPKAKPTKIAFIILGI
jgi:hypothetical protein